MASDGGDEAKFPAAAAAAAAAARSGGEGSDDFDHYNDDHDDDLDFDPSASEDDDDDDDDGEEDEEDNDDNNIDKVAKNDPIVLEGNMYLHDSGKIIFSGTWCLHSQLTSPSKSLSSTQTDTNNSKESEGILNDEERKQQTFRLESQDAFTAPSNPTSKASESSGDPSIFDSQGNIKESIKAKLNGPIAFDVRYPTMERLGVLDGILPQNAYIPERRPPILFDGYFIEPTSTANEKKKVKESNVAIIFSLCEMQFDNPKRYDVEGSGSNEYGTFVINGSYYIPRGEGSVNGNSGQTMAMASVWCTKTYDFNGGDEKKERREKRRGMKNKKGYHCHEDDDDDSYDDDFLEGKTDYAEVGELYQEATMSIEDLRRKYYGGGGAGDDADDDNVDDDDDDGGGKLPAMKKPRPSPTEDDSDDDDCGF